MDYFPRRFASLFFSLLVVAALIGALLVVVTGCGDKHGLFTFALADLTQHPVIAINIEQGLVSLLTARAATAGLTHVQSRFHDVTSTGLGVPPGFVDIVLLFNLLHCEEPLTLLTATREALRPHGRVGIINWRSDLPTPRGPSLAIRPTPQACVQKLAEAGFYIEHPTVTLPPYHFGIVGTRR